MQENLNDNCLALCDNAWVFYSLAAPGIFVGADVCAISHDKHQKFFRSCLTDTSFSHIPGLFFCTNTVDFFLIIFPKVLSSSSTRFSAATDLSANVSKHMAIPHNSKCRYGERGAADAKPKAQIILDAAKVSAASGGNSEPKQEQRSQSARGFCPPKHDAGTATRHYRAFWQRRCRAAAAGAVLKPQGGNCAVLPKAKQNRPLPWCGRGR